ncbi:MULTISPECIES: hypothetical protein [Microbulbifer]|uniref:hypothetical protein n=1 Tax=Microbulbifer TaxID=48073 RepID=UPI001E3F3401|nr:MULTISPECIES: hypothetical protein [Microbulbifer]UHQ54956.1 hypothetical protein LVE68_15830 [Microbulbifer sp. YPW16]
METNNYNNEGFTLFLGMAFALLLINLVGFGPTFFFTPLTEPNPKLDTTRIIHGFTFSAWYLLFCAQAIAAKSLSFRAHRTMGFIGLFLAIAIVINGSIMTAHFANEFTPTDEVGPLILQASGVWANFHLVLSFAAFIVLGMAFRKQLQLHKRFVLLATIAMMTAATSRIAAFDGQPIHEGAFTFLCLLVLLLTPICYELVQYRKVHPVYLWGSAAYFVSLILFAAVIPMTAFGQSAVFWFQ